MLRRMVICLIIVGAGAPFAASSSARERRHIDVTPFFACAVQRAVRRVHAVDLQRV
jgi:hypothetical protein